MKLSVVTTLYNSEDYIEEFYLRMCNAINNLMIDDYEIVFVDDGSLDNSLNLVTKISLLDKKVKVIELSKNFGHHHAIMCGLKYAKGELIFLIDVDLEELPEWLIDFYKCINNEDVDVVYGIQINREGSIFKKIAGHLFYSLVNYCCDSVLPQNPTITRLMTAQYVSSLLLYQENTIYIGGLMWAVGFKQIGYTVNKRYKGSTTYTLKHKIFSAINAITSFSSKPLFYVFNIGIVSFLLSSLVIIKILFNYFFYKIMPGWTSIVISELFIGSILMMSIGIVGLYIGKIFNEVKNRPNVVIKTLYGQDNTEK